MSRASRSILSRSIAASPRAFGRVWLPPLGALASAALLLAATGAQGAEAERYQLQRTETGFARIDTATGEVSSCTERGDQLVCRMAADERSALMAEIDALEERVAALEESGVGRALPSEEEMDRAIGLMERFMKGFVGVVRGLEGRDPL